MAEIDDWAPRAGLHAELDEARKAPWADFGKWPDAVFFPAVVGLELVEMRADYARMRLPFRPENRQPQGLLHGGAIATLIDTVVVPALASGYDDWRPFSTISLAIRYLAAVRDEAVIAEGWIEKRGRSIVFCNAEVATPAGRIVAQGEMVYKVSSPRSDAR